MKTILLVPTGESVGLTSACLGLIYALECQGIKAGFLKPFSQETHSAADRTTALYRHLFNNETVEPISHAAVCRRLSQDENDELLEDAVRLHREIAKKHDLIIVEGLVPTSRDAFASELNADLAKALDAKVVIVSTADLRNPEATAEKIEKIHTEYVSAIQYNNENSLSCVLSIAYLSAMQYYFKPIRELPTGRGFSDFVDRKSVV